MLANEAALRNGTGLKVTPIVAGPASAVKEDLTCG